MRSNSSLSYFTSLKHEKMVNNESCARIKIFVFSVFRNDLSVRIRFRSGIIMSK